MSMVAMLEQAISQTIHRLRCPAQIQADRADFHALYSAHAAAKINFC
jgi:hypothetical protein